jgi:hypothetical protein
MNLLKLVIYCGIISFCISCEFHDEFTSREYPFVETIGMREINRNGASINFTIKDFGKIGISSISSYGVIYKDSASGNKDDFFIQELKGAPNGNDILVHINHDLIPQTDYIAYPFVKASNQTILGSPLIFTSEGNSPPEITEISATKLGVNLQFRVIGKNFSSIEGRNIIEIPGTEEYFSYDVYYSTQDTLLVSVYPNIYFEEDKNQKFDFSVTVNNQNATIPKYFSIEYPKIQAIDNLEYRIGDEINVELNLEAEPVFLYLTVNYESQNGYLFLPLEKTDENKYKTTLTEFSKGNYPIGLFASYEVSPIAGVGVHQSYEKEITISD